MKAHPALGVKGKKLLALLVSEIERGRFVPDEPKTFISYGEVLDKLGIPRKGRAGQQLQREGLTELNEWTKSDANLPKIAGLIIGKQSSRPGPGFAPSHGHAEADWKTWWLAETARAIGFKNWDRYVGRAGFNYPVSQPAENLVREDAAVLTDYRQIITLEPGKRGGRPCIRGLRITVGDVLGWLAAGMSHQEIRSDFPEVTESDIRACLAFAADKESHEISLPT